MQQCGIPFMVLRDIKEDNKNDEHVVDMNDEWLVCTTLDAMGMHE
jgi:hypothetical protein